MTNKIWLLSLISMGIIAGCGNDMSQSKATHFVDSFPTTGSELLYSVLRDDVIDGKTNKPFEIRNGGYGSAMTAHPTQSDQFYALTDRGPNANYTGNYGKGKTFPVATYTPRIG